MSGIIDREQDADIADHDEDVRSRDEEDMNQSNKSNEQVHLRRECQQLTKGPANDELCLKEKKERVRGIPVIDPTSGNARTRFL
jgi:hypothetical protein